MLRKILLSLLLVPVVCSASSPVSLASIIDSLRAPHSVSGEAVFRVSMPQLSDDVVYELAFRTNSVHGDSLMPVNYLIDWTMKREGNPVKGFAAYYSGNHFRYNGETRLQEYHFKVDSVPFVAGKGVHRSAQFVDVLPFAVGDELAAMISDPNYTFVLHPDTLVGGSRYVALDAVMRVKGAVARESEYLFMPGSLAPYRIIHENNPGSVSEQTVEILYRPGGADLPGQIDEDALMERYPSLFADYRQSNFRIENLRGHQLPGMALPTTTGERYLRRMQDAFRTPTIVVLMESGAGFNPMLVRQVREAVDMLPYAADVLWVFADSHVDSIEEAVGPIREGEHLLMSGRGFISRCGASTLPAVIMTDSSAKVKNIAIGYDNDITLSVIENMAQLR